MFKKILVPLDGSRLAESILPAAEYLATKFGATLLLLHAIEKRAPQTVHGDRHLSDASGANAYLEQVAAQLIRTGVPTEKHVHTAEETDVAQSISRHAAELGVDLILLCTHGESGLRDVLVGNIAQQVIHRGDTPVFLLRPGNESAWQCKRILVPLDSAPVHEPALPIAIEFARACNAAIQTITVVPTMNTLSGERAAAGSFLPTTMNALLELAERGGKEYIENITRKLSSEGLDASSSIARGDAASEIVTAAERAAANLIVLATHGRGTIDAFWARSVTPHVIAHAPCPLLLVRVSGEESAR